jgi:hypothetical protein
MRACAILATAGMLLIPLGAHHAFQAEFDSSRPITVSGRVTKVEWLNPHARFYVAVPEPGGRINNWELELVSPNSLIRQGWNRSSLKSGDVVTVKGYRARDGSHLAAARAINFSDGRNVLVGTNGDGGPEK